MAQGAIQHCFSQRFRMSKSHESVAKYDKIMTTMTNWWRLWQYMAIGWPNKVDQGIVPPSFHICFTQIKPDMPSTWTPPAVPCPQPEQSQGPFFGPSDPNCIACIISSCPFFCHHSGPMHRIWALDNQAGNRQRMKSGSHLSFHNSQCGTPKNPPSPMSPEMSAYYIAIENSGFAVGLSPLHLSWMCIGWSIPTSGALIGNTSQLYHVAQCPYSLTYNEFYANTILIIINLYD